MFDRLEEEGGNLYLFTQRRWDWKWSWNQHLLPNAQQAFISGFQY